jgi:hypothetical protein
MSALLDHVGSHVDEPWKVLKSIKSDMKIHGLKGKLIKILSDFALKVELQRGCANVFEADNVDLLKKLNRAQKRGVRVPYGARCRLCGDRLDQNKVRPALPASTFCTL